MTLRSRPVRLARAGESVVRIGPYRRKYPEGGLAACLSHCYPGRLSGHPERPRLRAATELKASYVTSG